MSVLAEVADEIEDLQRYVDARLNAIRARLVAYEASLGKHGKVALIGPDGRLTDAGVRYCESAFAEGRGPSEIAAALGVTVPAIVQRRQRWLLRQKVGAN
jgi:hypothetical protein